MTDGDSNTEHAYVSGTPIKDSHDRIPMVFKKRRAAV
jgi:hypothetical protein